MASPQNTATVGPNFTRCPLVDTVLAGFGQDRAGNARRDDRRVGEERPRHLWRHRDRDFFADRNHRGRLSAITVVCRCTGTLLLQNGLSSSFPVLPRTHG